MKECHSLQKSSNDDDEYDNEGGFGPMPASTPKSLGKPSTSLSSALDSGVDDEDDDVEGYALLSSSLMTLHCRTVASEIPTAHEATLSFGNKPVSALGLDNQGSRLAVGGYDYRVNIYDFATMDSSLQAHRKDLTPVEWLALIVLCWHSLTFSLPCSYIINSLQYSCNSEYLLVASGFQQAVLLDSKGSKWTECVKGDAYVMDKRHTKGHTASLTWGTWHPFDKSAFFECFCCCLIFDNASLSTAEFLTTSEDGTMRVWSTEDYKVVTRVINTQRSVIRLKGAQGRK